MNYWLKKRQEKDIKYMEIGNDSYTQVEKMETEHKNIYLELYPDEYPWLPSRPGLTYTIKIKCPNDCGLCEEIKDDSYNDNFHSRKYMCKSCGNKYEQ